MTKKLILTLGLALLFVSCEKDPIDIGTITTLKDLKVPAGFTFETVRQIDIAVQLPSTVSYSTTNRIIQIWSAGADGKPDKLIKTGSADNSGRYEETLTVESFAKKLYVSTFAGWRTLTLTTSLFKSGSTKFTADYNVGYGRTAPKSGRGTPVSGLVAGQKNYFQSPGLKSSDENVVQNGDFSIEKLGRQEKWSSPMEIDGTWYATDEVRNNAQIITEDENGFLRFKNSYYNWGGAAQLVKANPGDILRFSADMRGEGSEMELYLYLIPRDKEGNSLDYFYYENYGVTKEWVTGSVVAEMPEGTASCEVLLWINADGTVDFDNVFVREGNAREDQDGDGVSDAEDQYPNDPERAYNDYMPSSEDMGSCAFEDLWPSYGDFDFNDLVFDYQLNRISNASNQVVQLDFLIQVRAIGASIRSGFGLQIQGLSTDLISSIDNKFTFTSEEVRFNDNGTEQGQKYATIIFFDDAYKLLPHPGDKGPGVNTSLGYTYVEPHTMLVSVHFTEPVDEKTINYDSFNPFIFYKEDRSHEIHMPGGTPTEMMNLALFGTMADASRPEEGYYYQDKNGIPWAISTPVLFDYTIEKSEIIEGHLHFKEWAYSGGKEYEDWYYDYKGYRNYEYIYSVK